MRHIAGRHKVGIALSLALLLSAVGGTYAQDATSELQTLQQDDAQWALPAKNFSGTRYSSLDQINAENVANLETTWTFSTGVLRGHEGQPLVVGETMYLVTPFPNIVYAIDLNTSAMRWKFEPEPDERAIESACCDVVNLGASYADDKLFFNTLDGQVYALNAKSGEVIWQAKNADPRKGATMTNVPLVVNDTVIVGVSGGEYGVRGYVTAYDSNTGEQAWRWYNTGPDKEVGITKRFKPFYASHKGKDLGVNTWPKDQWKLGGSTVWAWFTFDPELNLFYFGTGNPGTWNPSLRRGNPAKLDNQVKWANKWSQSIMARDADSGELVWAYQLTRYCSRNFFKLLSEGLLLQSV